MGTPTKERDWEDRARRFVKAELKRAGVGYGELATRLKKHGFTDTESSIAGKLNRGTFAATWFLAVLAALQIGTVNLEEL